MKIDNKNRQNRMMKLYNCSVLRMLKTNLSTLN